jgi:hypothetical protein
VAVYHNFYPVAYKEDGRLMGLDVELVERFAALHGLQVTFIEMGGFDSTWTAPGEGTADMAIGGITR